MKYFIFVLWLCFSQGIIASESRIYLYTPSTEIKTGSEFFIDVMVQAIPNVYGAHLVLDYDKKALTVIDQIEKESGIQIAGGDFFDNRNLYTMRNWTSIETGSIEYVVSQVAPAKSAVGSGRLARVFFKAKEHVSDTSISIRSTDFGTRRGEKYTFSKAVPLELRFDQHYHTPELPQKYLAVHMIGMFVLTLSILFFLKMMLVHKRRSKLAA